MNSSVLSIRGSVLLMMVILLMAPISASAGSWESPWPSVKGAAAKRCAETYEDYSLQSVCMENEKEGFEKMQRDFGMPTEVANKAKIRCEKTYKDFQLQAVCMENERDGFVKMQGDFGMPAAVAAKAKKRCQRTFADFQLQAVCMENESDGYNKMKTY